MLLAEHYLVPVWQWRHSCLGERLHLTLGTVAPAFRPTSRLTIFQIDYLPSDIAGGYLQAFNVWTGCATLTGSQFSGHRVRVEWDFWMLGETTLLGRMPNIYMLTGNSGP